MQQTTTGPHLLRVNTVTAIRLYPAEEAKKLEAASPAQEPDGRRP
ncbi:MAG: hypothetical protein WCF10_06480 [Polyangiales bacterium]